MANMTKNCIKLSVDWDTVNHDSMGMVHGSWLDSINQSNSQGGHPGLTLADETLNGSPADPMFLGLDAGAVAGH